MVYPKILEAQQLIDSPGVKRLLIAAYGFEARSLGWSALQKHQGKILSSATIIKYQNAKGENKIQELRSNMAKIGISYPDEIEFDILSSHNIENQLQYKLDKAIGEYDEIIVDITAMTKFLILVCLFSLRDYKGVLRIVYTEASDYAPKKADYDKSKDKASILAKFPSRGFEAVLRARCLSSIRMQGQPVVLVAFASFNEQLVKNMLGTINPHRLIFINGVPPRNDFKWREVATQEIHQKLINEYPMDNEMTKNNLLKRAVSTLEYRETITCIDELYKKYSHFERMIIIATGSKMQTVGLFFSKIEHPDIHIEYPTPDSYFFKGLSHGIRQVHEITIEDLSKLTQNNSGSENEIVFS